MMTGRATGTVSENLRESLVHAVFSGWPGKDSGNFARKYIKVSLYRTPAGTDEIRKRNGRRFAERFPGDPGSLTALSKETYNNDQSVF